MNYLDEEYLEDIRTKYYNLGYKDGYTNCLHDCKIRVLTNHGGIDIDLKKHFEERFEVEATK